MSRREEMLQALQSRQLASEGLTVACGKTLTGQMLEKAFELAGDWPPDFSHLLKRLDEQ